MTPNSMNSIFRKDQNLKTAIGPMKFECQIWNQWNFVHILMHDKEDMAMADQYSSALSTHPYSNLFLVRKSKMTLYPSKSSPCVEMSFEKCRIEKLWKHIKKKYNCSVPEYLQNRIHTR